MNLPKFLHAKVSEWHRRCEDCGSLVDGDRQEDLREHAGHRLRTVTYLSIAEWFRLKFWCE